MSLVDLLIVYGIAGVGCSVVVLRRQPNMRGLGSAALALVVWPLWAPVVLTATPERTAGRANTPAARRIDAALREGVEAAAATPLEKLLDASSAARIRHEVDRIEARRGELELVLARPGFDREAARARVESLEREGAQGRHLATARLHLDNVGRLHGLRARDERALEELAEVVEALRTQLVLARYAGSTVEGLGGMLAEVWTRVEGLGEAMDDAMVDARDEPGGDL